MTTAMNIERSAVLDAERERVWRAITKPEHFGRWFECELKFDRLAPGEKMQFAFGEHKEYGTIVTVEPPERYAFRWPAEPGSDTTTLVTFLLEPVPEGTRLTITETGFDALPAEVAGKRLDMNNEGWGIQLENIAKYLRTHDDV